ncbi:MAG: TIGR03619 family F420-dependent LLM class oxidoreductase, partial [Acidimicrobiia bacterium]
MRVGVHLANWGTATGSVERITALSQAAEDLGFDSVWVTDHVVIPDEFASAYPIPGITHTPDTAAMTFEPIMTLAVVAGATRRVGLGTSALISAQRNPLVTVKELTTLDVLSGGRLEVGLGAGWLEEEFAVLGAPPFAERGKVLDEHIAIFQAFWNEERPSFSGTYTSFPFVRFEPRPVRPGGPPLTIGGWSRSALRRAARVDGWQPINVTPDQLVEPMADLRRFRDELGRTTPPEVLLRCPAEVDDAAAPDPKRPLVGSAEKILDAIG